jgi:hypothetical protein
LASARQFPASGGASAGDGDLRGAARSGEDWHDTSSRVASVATARVSSVRVCFT